ncbi:MAG: zinc metallopeptidase [Bacillota bacterium]
MFFMGPYGYLVFIGLILVMWAQFKVTGTFNKFANIRTMSGYSGAETAQRLLRDYNLSEITVEMAQGFLGDHYDPRRKSVRLSPSVYQGRSLAAVSVAAHETGHAIQHARGYAPLQIRSALFPVASFGSTIGFYIAFFGLIVLWRQGNPLLFQLGMILFGAAVLFQVVTLPVEFNASSRALNMLGESGILSKSQELSGAKKVLRAAALTYVAAAAASILNLLRLLLMSQLGRRND